MTQTSGGEARLLETEIGTRTLRLELPWPPSGNRYWRMFVPPAKPQAARMIVSAEAKRYRKMVTRLISHQCADFAQFTGRLSVSLTLHAPTRRKYDIDNRAKVLLDALQAAGVMADDEQVDALRVVRGNVRTGDGWVMVYVEQIQGLGHQ